jgi:arylsulfatase
MKRIVIVAAFALAAAVVVMLMYGRGRRPRNVVIVVLDAARADHLGCYGYPRDTTPNIDALAAEALRFTRHYTPIPSTTPSTASLFTGQYPDTHRIIYPTWEHPEPEHTLASVLGARGFATALFSSTLMASPEMDVGTRFQTAVYRTRGDYTIGFQPDRLLAQVEPWLDAHAAEAFFLYVHFIPPHGPYEELERFMEFAGKEAPGVEGCRPGDFEFPLYADGERPEEPEPPPLPRWADLYDANLCYGDWAVGELVEMLRERDLLENTLLIVTSDHGEAFGEHGYIWHTNAIHQEVARIPLLIRPPGGVRPEARETLSDTTDVFPTVC